MRVVILLLTLVSQNLAEGNSSLGASFALGGNFGEQQTQKSSFIPKISSKYKTSTANTRIFDLDSANQTQNAESSAFCHSNSFFCHSERSEESKIWVENDRNRARIAESALDSAIPTKSAESSEINADSAPSKQEANSSIVDEFSHLCEASDKDRTNGSSRKRALRKCEKSPQDAEFATCKDDITGFWLSPRDKVSARTSIIEIFKKDGKYFAYNVAFLDELPPKKDALNQNFALRDREILGSVYAYNLERSGEASYINGRYYDFNRGKIFHLKAKLDCNELILLISADNVGFLGKKKIYKALEKNEAEFYIKTRPTIDFSGVK